MSRPFESHLAIRRSTIEPKVVAGNPDVLAEAHAKHGTSDVDGRVPADQFPFSSAHKATKSPQNPDPNPPDSYRQSEAERKRWR
jgi:hypothetical protein